MKLVSVLVLSLTGPGCGPDTDKGGSGPPGNTAPTNQAQVLALAAPTLTSPAASSGDSPVTKVKSVTPTCNHGPTFQAGLAGLATELSNPAGLGPTVAELVKAGDIGGAFDNVRKLLPTSMKGATRSGELFQHGDSRSTAAVAFVVSTIEGMEEGEKLQVKIENDSGWRTEKSGCLVRTFSNQVDGVRVSSTQHRHGSPASQESSYSWTKWWHSGGGTDTILPIVDRKGEVRAVLLFSTYRDTYSDAAAEQRKAIKTWKSLVPRPK